MTRRWNRSEVDQLVLMMGQEPPARRTVIASALDRPVRQVHAKIDRLRASGKLSPSTWALMAAMHPEQCEVLALYRRKEMPAWQGIKAALAVRAVA